MLTRGLRRRLRGSDRQSERGFTLAELLVSIVILGLIMGALCQALFVAMRVPSQGAEHLADAWENAKLANYFSDDTANATTVDPGPWTAIGTKDCKLTLGAPPSFSVYDTSVFKWTDNGVQRSVWYWALIVPVSGSTTEYEVVVRRRYDDNTAVAPGGVDTIMFEGYCTKDATNVLSYTNSSGVHTFVANLAATPGGTPRKMQVKGLQRTPITSAVTTTTF
jgi:prepilin-type N-terminal cleavage/methylation domain-containing protein